MARVLFTGASSGIGQATILEPAPRGHEVVATARRRRPWADLPAASGSLRGFTVQPTVDAAIAAGPFDGLISNASDTARHSRGHAA
jgi:NAD(P)-dependent dehydrogenase (short-subunit alcohol dehydrogenase family)